MDGLLSECVFHSSPGAGYRVLRAQERGLTLDVIGFVQQAALLEREADRLGIAPLVIDSDDILANPEAALRQLCGALGVSFTPSMLHWPAGGNPADGIWARHWYGAVHRSTGLTKTEPAVIPDLDGIYRKIEQQALPFYHRLAANKLTVG